MHKQIGDNKIWYQNMDKAEYWTHTEHILNTWILNTYWTHEYYIRHIIGYSYCSQSLIGLANLLWKSHILLQISCFKTIIREYETHNYLSFVFLYVINYIWSQIRNSCELIISCSLVNLLKYEFCKKYGWK